MQTKLLESKTQISLSPKEDIQYVLVPSGEVEVTITPQKEGTKTELLVLYSLKDKETVKILTNSVHIIPGTTCFVNVKAVLRDFSQSNYTGKIIIEKEAQQTASYLEDNVLVLGRNVKNESQPILEIEADDVKASHGATTGNIDKNQIYYLMSRGISREDAENMVVEGFFESLLDKIADGTIREKVRMKIYA